MPTTKQYNDKTLILTRMLDRLAMDALACVNQAKRLEVSGVTVPASLMLRVDKLHATLKEVYAALRAEVV